MKAIWTGAIGFGLINIPIRVYPASEEHTLEFHLLHKKDLSPIRFARICQEEGKEVPYSDIVKGFEYEKGSYVVLDEEDFKAANAKKTSTIEIQHFTEIDQIDPIYYEKPYFLEPDKKSGRAYKLLWEALFKSRKIGIGNFVFRNREHIGALIPTEEGLLLIQMRYHIEVRPFEKLELPKEKASEQELKMALTLIDQLTRPFEPEKHHDTYVEELMKHVQRKLEGKKKLRKKVKASRSPHEAKDLMGLLQESMKKTLEGTHRKRKTPLAYPSPKPSRRRTHS